MGNAGRVLMIPKGDYNAATTYERLDFVYYQGRSYVCKQTSTGNVPTNTTYWQALTGDASAEIQALTNYVTETGVKNVLSIGHIKALNYTGTWSGNTYTKNGITTTVNSDGTLSLNGTASEDMTLTLAADIIVDKDEIISGCPAGGATTKYFLAFEKKTNPWTRYATDLGEGATITTRTTEDNVVYFRVRSGQTVSNLLVKPMIRDATISDATYAPYALTNTELTEKTASIDPMLNVLGAKNLLPLSLAHIKANNTTGTWNGNAYTQSDVTFTVNTDSNGNVTSITSSGTPSALVDFRILNGITSIGAGTYTLNGCPSGGDVNTYYMLAQTDGIWGTVVDTGSGATATLATGLTGLVLRVRANVDVTGKTWKPMLRDASIADDTFAPYAKTNVELTADIEQLNVTISDASSERDFFEKLITKLHNDITVTQKVYFGYALYLNNNSYSFEFIKLTDTLSRLEAYQSSRLIVAQNNNGTLLVKTVILTDMT